MSDKPLVLAVGSYEARAAAERDLERIGSAPCVPSEPLAAAMVEKGADGQLRLERQVDASHDPAWARLVLGAALTVIATPIGLAFLAPFVHGVPSWSGVASLVGVFWHQIAKDDLRRMSELLEAGQAAIVVVAVAANNVDVVARLSGAAAAVVNDEVSADLRQAFACAATDSTTLA
jgi:hypothetical protein